MTKEVAIAQIIALTPLTADDIAGLQRCSEPQLELVLRVYKESGKAADKAIWEKVAAIFQQVPDWVSTGASIVGAIAKIFP